MAEEPVEVRLEGEGILPGGRDRGESRDGLRRLLREGLGGRGASGSGFTADPLEERESAEAGRLPADRGVRGEGRRPGGPLEGPLALPFAERRPRETEERTGIGGEEARGVLVVGSGIPEEERRPGGAPRLRRPLRREAEEEGGRPVLGRRRAGSLQELEGALGIPRLETGVRLGPHARGAPVVDRRDRAALLRAAGDRPGQEERGTSPDGPEETNPRGTSAVPRGMEVFRKPAPATHDRRGLAPYRMSRIPAEPPAPTRVRVKAR